MVNEKQMIEALKKQNEDAFEYLYYKYQKIVYYVIYSILKNRQASEEVMQDTFLRMYHEIDKFDGRYFKAWLLKIAKNLAINRYQKNQKMVEFSDYLIDLPTSEYKTWELIRELETILNQNEYEVVVLKIIYNMKQREIAEYLDKPLGTVSWIYREGIKKLKKHYWKEE